MCLLLPGFPCQNKPAPPLLRENLIPRTPNLIFRASAEEIHTIEVDLLRAKLIVLGDAEKGISFQVGIGIGGISLP